METKSLLLERRQKGEYSLRENSCKAVSKILFVDTRRRGKSVGGKARLRPLFAVYGLLF